MKLNVNPNRMELLRLRRRLALAERGHKLLKDKLEEIMRRFLETIRRLSVLQDEVSAGLDRIFLAFALAVGPRTPREELEPARSRGRARAGRRDGRASSASPSRSSTVESLRVSILRPPEHGGRAGHRREAGRDARARSHGDGPAVEDPSISCRARSRSRAGGSTRWSTSSSPASGTPSIPSRSRLEEMERSTQVQLMRVKEIIRHH